MAIKNAVKGSYYIRVRDSGWFLWHQSWDAGKRIQARVDGKAYLEFGFKAEMSVDEAKARCVQLNKERSLIREKIRVSAKRVTELRTIDEMLFPQVNVEAFQELLEDENFGSTTHLSKLYIHFNFIQKMCNELRILPVEYKDSTKKIYKYFMKKKISVNYAGRLISLLNRWGKFVSKHNGTFYDVVSVPKGRERSAIADAQLTKEGKDTELGVRQASLPLTPVILKKSKDKLSVEQYNWLFISVWLGLRPEEIEELHDESTYRVEFMIKRKLKVLHVYQGKLQSIAENKRWKAIPIVFPEQEECLTIISEGTFKKPLYKTMRKYVGKGITLYGGRKNFVDMMLSLDQKLEDISMWLGHKDISTTWQDYKDKNQVGFTETEVTKTKAAK